jgi:hypothetical protein
VNTPLRRCDTPGCKNEAAPDGRTKCGVCANRLWRERHPAAAAFYNLKHRAKERGKLFLITRKQFEDWCAETNYHELKAKSKFGMSVDRIKEELPYEIRNIQMITLGENSSKYQHYAKSKKTFEPVISASDEPPF